MDVTLDQVFKMTERRFQVGRRLIQNKPWDFFMLCRHRAWTGCTTCFWQYFDPRHPLYRPGNKYETTFQDYYRFLDEQVGSLLELVPDDAITMVMSDHGARPMMGGLCFNDWLMQEGYLTLNAPVSKPTPIKDALDRLEPHGGLGRRRLLRALVPQREGPRAEGHRGARATTRPRATS